MHFRCSYFLILLLVLFVCVHGQELNTHGFINIDCGLPSNSTYVDSFFTGLTYLSDDQFIDTGLNGKISSQYPVHKDKFADLETVRFFPNGTKNCYTLTPVIKGSKYFVRATFYYGNYDNLDTFPKYDLYFGVNFWVTVEILRPDYQYPYEIIAIAPANYIQVCLVNTGLGTPFINVLELRPLNSTLYELTNPTQSLILFARKDVASNNNLTRYHNDSHDRLWFSYTQPWWKGISTNSSIDGFDFDVPSLVLQTAAVSPNSSMDITWSTSDKSTIFFVVLHFAEIQILQNTSIREFYIYSNGVQLFEDPVPLGYLTPSYVSYVDNKVLTEHNVSLQSSARATLPPILNALEVYGISPIKMLPTDNEDVNALNSIKASYSIRKGWSGDPCVPTSISWTGVNCISNLSNIPRITALNLSESGLTGAMVSAFGYLTELETLDLSHNNMSGDIPNSLDQLKSLTFLDLSGNSGLSRKLPPGLQQKQNDGHLTVIFDITSVGPDHKKPSKAVIFVIVAVIIMLLIIGAIALFLSRLKIKTKSSSHIFDGTKDLGEYSGEQMGSNFDKKQFSYEELKVITSNFSEKIGSGGFGEVFKGQLKDGNEVAVKVRLESSSQGTRQFLNEVEMLSRVHHKNLVSLTGYCKDKNHLALVYEYMQEGNLQDRLKGNVRSLSWRQRVQIVYESAQGLEYLHRMCNPPLIHRDVKTSNILLTRNLEAKVSDFGLVRSCLGTHVSTRVMGTPGYLDPDFAFTSHLTEKSDVYSFGVVLLETITGKQPIGHGLPRGEHLTQFVQQKLSKGDIESILDPHMGRQYNLNSVWKVADVALRCTDNPDIRPDMTQVVTELKESLSLELSSTGTSSMASENIIDFSDYSKNNNHVSGGIPSDNF